MLTQDQFRVVIDVNYDTRVQLGHTGTLSTELYALGVALKGLKLLASTNNATEILVWKQKWATKANISELLGAMAASPMGRYYENRPAIDALAAWLGVTVREGMVLTPAPAPAPAPVVVPPPPTTEPAPVPVPVPPAPSGDHGDLHILPGVWTNKYGQYCVGGKVPYDPRTGQPFLNYGLFVRNIDPRCGAGIAYVVTTPGLDPQRPGENLKRVGNDTVSLDGGRRIGGNALYVSHAVPGDTDSEYEPWIPDGARPVWTLGADSLLDNVSMNAEPVESDPHRPGYNRKVPQVVKDANAPGGKRRITAGQRMVIYLLGRWGLPGVFISGMQRGDPVRLMRSGADHNAVDTDVIDEKIEAAFRARGL